MGAAPRQMRRRRWLCTVCGSSSSSDECSNPLCRLSFKVAGVCHSPSAGVTRRCQMPRPGEVAPRPPEIGKRPRELRATKPSSAPPRTKRPRRPSEIEAVPPAPPRADADAGGERAAARGQYRCARCGLLKRGHTCLGWRAEPPTVDPSDAYGSECDTAEPDDEANASDVPAPGGLILRVRRPFVYITELHASSLPITLTPIAPGEDVPESPRRGSLRARPEAVGGASVPLLLQRTSAGSATWGDYWEVVADVLPNVPQDRLKDDAHAISLVLVEKRGRKRRVLGGTTFRLLLEQEDDEPTRLVVDVLLLAISTQAQGRGHGSSTVHALKRLAVEQAIARGYTEALMLTQADNLAVTFWSKHGLSGGPRARKLVHGLEEWRAEDNPIYFGSTPMLMQICRRLGSNQSREILRG